MRLEIELSFAAAFHSACNEIAFNFGTNLFLIFSAASSTSTNISTTWLLPASWHSLSPEHTHTYTLRNSVGPTNSGQVRMLLLLLLLSTAYVPSKLPHRANQAAAVQHQIVVSATSSTASETAEAEREGDCNQ